VRVGFPQSDHHVEAPVPRAVIDVEDFPRTAHRVERARDLAVEDRQIRFLVEHGDDDRDLDGSGHRWDGISEQE